MKPEAALDFSHLLDAVPMRNQAVRSERRGDHLVLFVPIRKRWWMYGPLSWLLPFREERGVALDPLGEEVWTACDGERRVENIVEGFAERHRVRFHEARASVASFLRSLVERNLVVVSATGDSAAVEPAAAEPSTSESGAAEVTS
jgi:hypothetical protein